MKTTGTLAALLMFPGIGCSSPQRPEQPPSSKDSPETVLISYHARSGQEQELREVLAQAWQIYRRERLVLAEPHLLARQAEEGDGVRLIEVFTWISHAAPDGAPEAVKLIWEKEKELCEARGAHGGIEGGEVDLLLPAIP